MSFISFDEFKKEYMGHFDGYMPTYVGADEEFKCEGKIRINIEMIAPARMTDGPSRFFRVLSVEVTEEQYKELKEYIDRAGKAWRTHLRRHINNSIDYSNNFKG